MMIKTLGHLEKLLINILLWGAVGSINSLPNTTSSKISQMKHGKSINKVC